jgi:hypothetical protein
LTLHFGLGIVSSVDSVDIRWPNGGVQAVGKTPADQTIHVVEQVK